MTLNHKIEFTLTLTLSQAVLDRLDRILGPAVSEADVKELTEKLEAQERKLSGLAGRPAAGK